MNLQQSIPSAAVTASGQSAWFDAVNVNYLSVGIDVTAVSGTAPTLNLFVEFLGADGNAYVLWAPAQVTAVGLLEQVINVGAAGAVRLRWAVGGTTPSFTFSASLEG